VHHAFACALDARGFRHDAPACCAAAQGNAECGYAQDLGDLDAYAQTELLVAHQEVTTNDVGVMSHVLEI
jgi:hypothetical protein